MAPLLRTLLVIALLAGLAGVTARSGSRPKATGQIGGRAGEEGAAPLATPSATNAWKTHCPSGTLQDQGVCVPVPPTAATESAARVQERIPRLPGRPAAYSAYHLPVALTATGPDAGAVEMRSDAFVRLEARADQRASLVTLEGQQGSASLFEIDEEGQRVATIHRATTAGREHGYLVVLGQLRPATQSLPKPGAPLEAKTELGQLTATALALGIFRLRRHADLESLTLARALEPAHSIAMDPRNVLRLTE